MLCVFSAQACLNDNNDDEDDTPPPLSKKEGDDFPVSEHILHTVLHHMLHMLPCNTCYTMLHTILHILHNVTYVLQRVTCYTMSHHVTQCYTCTHVAHMLQYHVTHPVSNDFAAWEL